MVSKTIIIPFSLSSIPPLGLFGAILSSSSWFWSALEADIGEIEKHYEAIHRRIKFNSMLIRKQLMDVGYWNDDLLEERAHC